jgi:hypothetical protein
MRITKRQKKILEFIESEGIGLEEYVAWHINAVLRHMKRFKEHPLQLSLSLRYAYEDMLALWEAYKLIGEEGIKFDEKKFFKLLKENYEY